MIRFPLEQSAVRYDVEALRVFADVLVVSAKYPADQGGIQAREQRMAQTGISPESGPGEKGHGDFFGGIEIHAACHVQRLTADGHLIR